MVIMEISAWTGQVISVQPLLDYGNCSWESGYNNKQPVSSENIVIVEYTAHPSAFVYLSKSGESAVPVSKLQQANGNEKSFAYARVPEATRRLTLKVKDKMTGRPVPVKIHIHGASGEYLPPLNRHRIPNRFWYEDYSADFVNGSHLCTYIDSEAEYKLPLSEIFIEVSNPGTMAGTLAQQNAEILAGICIIQMIQLGIPICYGGICHAFDMLTTQLIFGGPEQAIFGVAMTQMGKYYGFPVYINTGLTDSKRPDAQAGLEAGITLSLGAAAGADIFGHMGICGVDQASSLDILILQNEIISYIESSMREIDFSDECIGLDEIGEVGPGGTFIDRINTAEHFRQELWFPEMLDRNYYQQWLDNGAAGIEELCRKQKEELLEIYTPEPVSDELIKTLDEIVAEAKNK